MRERTPLPRNVLERLPKLRLIASAEPVNSSIDIQAAAERGIGVVHTGYDSTPTVELTWALILASARFIAAENAAVRSNGWQRHVGDSLSERTLGLVGFDRRLPIPTSGSGRPGKNEL